MRDEVLSDFAWSSAEDVAARQFLFQKYKDAKARDALGEDWLAKRKFADKNKFVDGAPNPHYPRLNVEADLARSMYEIGHLVEMNNMLFTEVELLRSVLGRVELLEGAYGHLRSRLSHVTDTYSDSVRKHYEDRKRYSTELAMRRAGLDPDKQEDRLTWAKRLDEIQEKLFKMESADVQGSGITGEESIVLPRADGPKDE